ncbi:MAG: hypothetical protein EZS28_016939 [Streblomastix strix]|uniref:Uncharacterized protein n=1 Tax=Streblomastix strix TaxID=222440 RepID=A0A5J4VY63_9EUKA|nr:MAG: hypothetical protein EZS28_016939 [Streblomastix strix]
MGSGIFSIKDSKQIGQHSICEDLAALEMSIYAYLSNATFPVIVLISFIKVEQSIFILIAVFRTHNYSQDSQPNHLEELNMGEMKEKQGLAQQTARNEESALGGNDLNSLKNLFKAQH